MLMQSLTPSQLPERVFKRQGSFRGAPRYAEIGIPGPDQIPCEVYIQDADTYVPVKVVNEPEWIDESSLPPIDDAVQAKRERLAAMQSAAFHYLDAAAVREAYAQEIAASEGRAADPKSELSAESAFLAYQRQLMSGSDVVLDLEFDNRKPEELVQFDRTIRWLKTKYPTTLASEAVIRRTRQRIAREETAKHMDRLRSGGRAVIHAAFRIDHPKTDVLRLSLFCPATPAFPENLRIEVNLKADRIAENWRDQYAMESTITAYVMGTPLNWIKQTFGDEQAMEEVWVVSMKPFAIYS